MKATGKRFEAEQIVNLLHETMFKEVVRGNIKPCRLLMAAMLLME